MLDHVYQGFHDSDGNFLEQFQTTGFDARYFELYLFAYFSRSGFTVDRSHPTPDFMVGRNGITVAVEATTVNPFQGSLPPTQPFVRSEYSAQELVNYQNQELPIKFGSPLFSKLKRKYWDIEHCREKPFVLAIEAFHDEEALSHSASALIQYLYGQRPSNTWLESRLLKINIEEVELHESGDKTIPSNFFGQPGTENISAVLFTNSGTHAKFTRMGYQSGFGFDHVDISRSGFCYNPHPDAKDPTYFSYSLNEPPFVESWGQGVVVNHNPNALFPVPKDFFPGTVQAYAEGGELIIDYPSWYPISSKTFVRYFANPALRPPKAARVAIAAISRKEFDSMRGFTFIDSNPFVEEDGWFTDETESFLGVVVRDKTDKDWGYVILARDEHFQFRAIDTDASIEARDFARSELQIAMAKLVGESQRIFSQGILEPAYPNHVG